MVTDDDIRALRDEAGTAGDLEQVAVCDRALDGSGPDWAECERVIGDTAAMEDEAPVRSCQFHGTHPADAPPCVRPGESGMQYAGRMLGYTRDV